MNDQGELLPRPSLVDHWAGQMVKSAPQKMARRRLDYARSNPEVAAAILRALDAAGRCRACGKKLEDPLSVERKIGPDCWAKGERVADD